MFKIGIALILLIVINACELVNEVNYKELNTKSYLVINGFISRENGIEVLLSRTVPVNNATENDQVENPKVWLCENGQPSKQLIKKGAYKYVLSKDSVLLKESKSYCIKVEADGYKTAISNSQQLVPKVKIDTAYVDLDSNYLYYKYYDNPLQKNYYSEKIRYYSNGVTEDYDSTRVVPNYVDNDDKYNGKVIRYFKLPLQKFDSVQIKLYSVSADYYDFIQSYFDNELSSEDYNYETVYPVSSFIENGFGIFTSYEVSKYVFLNSIQL